MKSYPIGVVLFGILFLVWGSAALIGTASLLYTFGPLGVATLSGSSQVNLYILSTPLYLSTGIGVLLRQNWGRWLAVAGACLVVLTSIPNTWFEIISPLGVAREHLVEVFKGFCLNGLIVWYFLLPSVNRWFTRKTVTTVGMPPRSAGRMKARSSLVRNDSTSVQRLILERMPHPSGVRRIH